MRGPAFEGTTDMTEPNRGGHQDELHGKRGEMAERGWSRLRMDDASGIASQPTFLRCPMGRDGEDRVTATVRTTG